MSVTVQQLYVRAKNSTPANADLIPVPSDVLAVVEAEQQGLFAGLAGLTRDRFQTTASLASTSAASARVFDLSTLSPPVERVLQLTLSDGREAHQVDVLDTDAELSPRYIVRGQTLIEVSNDWLTGTGSVTASLVYVYGPTAMSVTGNYTQTITVPDAWSDLLVVPLQLYFAAMRNASADETGPIQQKLTERRQAFVDYLTNYGGVESKRFDIPTPSASSGKK